MKKLLMILALVVTTLVTGTSLVLAEYYMIPDYQWDFTTVTVNATAKTITFPRSAGIVIQTIGNDIYISKNSTATADDFKLTNGSTVDFQSFMVKKGEYVSIKAGSSTIATVNYSFKQ